MLGVILVRTLYKDIARYNNVRQQSAGPLGWGGGQSVLTRNKLTLRTLSTPPFSVGRGEGGGAGGIWLEAGARRRLPAAVTPHALIRLSWQRRPAAADGHGDALLCLPGLPFPG
jgi:hypothetical protein